MYVRLVDENGAQLTDVLWLDREPRPRDVISTKDGEFCVLRRSARYEPCDTLMGEKMVVTLTATRSGGPQHG